LPTIEIGGRVTTPGGKPRGGVQVKVAHDDGKAAAWFVASAITNDHGAFVIRNLPKRSDRVGLAGKAVRQGNRVIGQRFAQTPEPVVVSDNREDVVLYMPETGGTIKGRVLSGVTRQPVRSFQASFIRYKWFVPDDTSTYHIESDVGSFKGEVTEPGTWAVEIRAPGHATLRTKTFQLKKGGTVDLGTIELGSGGTISGVVRDAQGRPVPYARIHILDQAFKTNDQAPFTDVDGMFEVRGISPGKYSVFAVSPRHPLGILRGVAVENDKRTAADFQLLLASPLTVTVLDPSGDPLEGVDLSYTFAAVAPLNSKLFRGYEPPGWGLHRTDSRGRILKPSLPAGAVRIILNKAGFVQLSETVTLEAGKPNEVTLTMKRR
ncbi:MAG: carboxypeptidase regulatory-like domain-containing protein, partial [Planctomycetota bacterium]